MKKMLVFCFLLSISGCAGIQHQDGGVSEMLQPTSPEMNRFTKEFLAALARRDAAYVREHALSRPEGVYVGVHTEPGNVDYSPNETARRIDGHTPAGLTGSDPKGWTDGNIAWLVDFPFATLANGVKLEEPVRLTVVLYHTQHGWKVAHWHISESVDWESIHAVQPGGGLPARVLSRGRQSE